MGDLVAHVSLLSLHFPDFLVDVVVLVLCQVKLSFRL